MRNPGVFRWVVATQSSNIRTIWSCATAAAKTECSGFRSCWRVIRLSWAHALTWVRHQSSATHQFYTRQMKTTFGSKVSKWASGTSSWRSYLCWSTRYSIGETQATSVKSYNRHRNTTMRRNSDFVTVRWEVAYRYWHNAIITTLNRSQVKRAKGEKHLRPAS